MAYINENFLKLKENYLFIDIAKKLNAYREANPDKKLIRMGIGDVTRPLAPVVVEAMKKAADEMGRPETFRGYEDSGKGYDFLREEISGYYKNSIGADVSPDEILISDGAKSDCGNIVDIFSSRNRIVITDPAYPVYVDSNTMSGKEIIYASSNEENGFAAMPDESVDCDIIYLCSPNNPTGSVYTKEQLKVWVDYAVRKNAIIIFDSAYEAFIRVVDSMAAQHAKWLKVCNQLTWRRPIASLNFILTSNVWQQDHNGFTHQDPGFLDHIANKKADVVRMYLPPDTNCLLSCFDHCVKSKNYVNAIVASKHPSYQWLSMEQAVKHCTQGVGIWEWASNDEGEEPDIVMACCGDTPTLETMAAVTILRDELPELKIRVVNVVDLFKLESNHKHPHGLSDSEYNAIFTTDKPVIFAFHGYPTLIHELTYRRDNQNGSVHGYQEEGTITTPFDMRVQNEIDRFNLVKDAIMHLPQLGNKGSYLIQQMNDKLVAHKNYIHEVGQDLPEIIDWKWHLPENT